MFHPPTSVQIEPTTRCNIRCRFCPVTSGRYGKDMPWEVFERILPAISPDCLGVLYGNGEPLLHPRFLDMCRALRDRGARVVTSTNGMAVSDLGADQLSEAGLNEAIFSIAGLRHHEELQVGVSSKQVWKNLRACAEIGIRVRGYYLMMQRTIVDMPEFVRRLATAGGSVFQPAALVIGPTHELADERLKTGDSATTLRLIRESESLAEQLHMEVVRAYEPAQIL